jgi:hypothetical protein
MGINLVPARRWHKEACLPCLNMNALLEKMECRHCWSCPWLLSGQQLALKWQPDAPCSVNSVCTSREFCCGWATYELYHFVSGWPKYILQYQFVSEWARYVPLCYWLTQTCISVSLSFWVSQVYTPVPLCFWVSQAFVSAGLSFWVSNVFISVTIFSV